MNLIDDLLRKISAFPRAIQWALYAAVGIIAFLVWDSTINTLANDWKNQGDQIVEEVHKLQGGGELASKYRKLDPVIQSIGPIDLPQVDKVGYERLVNAVNEVLLKHTISDEDHGLHTKGKLSTDEGEVLKTVPDAVGKSVSVLEYELKFDATLEQAIQVISELESRPEITSISSLRLLRDKSKKIKVRLTVEAWVLTKQGGNV